MKKQAPKVTAKKKSAAVPAKAEKKKVTPAQVGAKKASAKQVTATKSAKPVATKRPAPAAKKAQPKVKNLKTIVKPAKATKTAAKAPQKKVTPPKPAPKAVKTTKSQPAKKPAVAAQKPVAIAVPEKIAKAPVKKPAIVAKVVPTKPAKEPAKKALKKNLAVEGKGGAKVETSLKTRSHHLMKILALREARKIKSPEEVRGATSAVIVKGKAAGSSAKAVVTTAPEPLKKKKKLIHKAPYTKAELKELKKLLGDERERLLRDLRSLDDMADSNKETTHATFSSHQADAASDSASLENTFIQRRMEEERFAWVTEALSRLDKGTYGLCDLCADEPAKACPTCPYIPIERLQAKPHAKMCVQMRTQMEKRNRR